MNIQTNGHLPAGWQKKRVGELFKVVGGGTPSTEVPEYWRGDIPWITSADINENHAISPRRAITKEAIANSATNLVPKDSVIIVTRVGLGKVAIAPSDLCFSQDSQALLFNPETINPRFVVHQMGELVSVFKHISRGTTINGVTKKQLADLEFLLPPRQDQDAIVSEIEKQLTRLDAGTEGLSHVQEKLKKYRAAVLKAACEGPWPRMTVAEVAEDIRYGTSAKTSENSDGVPVLRMGNIVDGKLNFDKLKYLPRRHPEFPDLLLNPGDLLFNRTNSKELVGKTAVYQGSPEPCSLASYLIRVKLKKGYEPKFLSYFINSPIGRHWVDSVVSQQVGQANVNGTKLKALSIPCPPPDEQKRIVAGVERRLSVIEELDTIISANLQRAARLRQSILHQAFTGKLIASTSENLIVPKLQTTRAKGPNRHFARALLSAEIVHKLHDEPTFGRVKHQKIFHLCEHIAQIGEIAGEYHREAAGPLDNRLIYANEAELKKQKWYEAVPRTGHGHEYRALSKAGGHAPYLKRYWPDKLDTVRRLIEMMRDWKTERCEIFSTTYAAWNDLIHWKREVTDEAILNEILNRWNDSKRQIPEDRWRKAIAWARDNGFTPTGFGRPTGEKQ